MSKKMTPCEKLGYKVGDEFEVIRHHAFKNGQVVTLHEDDGTECPLFAGDGGGAGVFDGVECSYATLNKQVRKIANKLKPAKQALADAIHQNGGWPIEVHWLFSTSSRVGAISFWVCRPKFNSTDWFEGVARRVTIMLNRCLPNWHQCILSRGEYFIAYPEQVNVEVKNETERKVEVEVKSESEMTINVSDWHKNGELPPVGVGVQLWHGGAYAYDCEVIAKRGNSYVLWNLTWDRADSADCSMCEFRPIRTEREKAIDEIVCEFIDHHGDPKGGERYLGIAAKLYDAGYRKEVK